MSQEKEKVIQITDSHSKKNQIIGQKRKREQSGRFDMEISVHRKNDTFAIQMKPIQKEDEVRDYPICFGIALDISGSMFESIELAKAAVIQALGMLKKGDCFILVTFSTTAEVVINDFIGENAFEMVKLIKSIHTTGQTNIMDAICKLGGAAKIRQNMEKHLYLFTDGDATTGFNSDEMSQGQHSRDMLATIKRISEEEGVMFGGIGFGSDFNESFVGAIPKHGKGQYLFIQDTEALSKGLITTLKLATSVIATEMSVFMPGEIMKTYKGEDSDERTVEIGSLHVGDEKCVIVDLKDVEQTKKICLVFNGFKGKKGVMNSFNVPIVDITAQEISDDECNTSDLIGCMIAVQNIKTEMKFDVDESEIDKYITELESADFKFKDFFDYRMVLNSLKAMKGSSSREIKSKIRDQCNGFNCFQSSQTFFM